MRMRAPMIAVAVLGLSGCSTIPVACPAIAYLSSVAVTAKGAVPADALLRACVSDECLTEGEPASQTDASAVRISRNVMGEWTVQFGSSQPDALDLTLLSHDGAIIAAEQYELEWERVGGSEQCGGPVRTDPLTLTVR